MLKRSPRRARRSRRRPLTARIFQSNPLIHSPVQGALVWPDAGQNLSLREATARIANCKVRGLIYGRGSDVSSQSGLGEFGWCRFPFLLPYGLDLAGPLWGPDEFSWVGMGEGRASFGPVWFCEGHALLSGIAVRLRAPTCED